MLLFASAQFLLFAGLGPLAAQGPSTAPASVRLTAFPAPTPGNFSVSPDGRFRWIEGDDHVFVRESPEKPERRVSLPRAARAVGQRTLLFAERGPRFCILDEENQEFGLHLDSRRGAETAKALLLASTLRLMDSDGHVLWTRRMPDKAIVGKAGAARRLSIANDGTVAVLLQDVDPYAKARPYLYVFDSRGRDLKSLDYTQWTKIDEFALAHDGSALAVRGFGNIPKEEGFAKAFGYYPLSAKKGFLFAAPGMEGGLQLRGFDSALWACCFKEGGQLWAVSPAGAKQAVPAGEADQRFGPLPSK